MTKEDFKKYTVKVANGSGCLFQPMTQEYIYVLTAKHLFFTEKDNGRDHAEALELPDGSKVPIKIHQATANGWGEKEIEFYVQKGKTYFPHDNADIAILILNHIGPFDYIFIQNQIDGQLNYEMCGFPGTAAMNPEGDRYTTHAVERFIASGNLSHSAQLNGGLNQNNIEGMSGGGLLRISNDYISIIGIQSKMATQFYPAGQIGFVPMRFFNDIIEHPVYKGKLEKLLPPYLKSFSFIEDDIFKIVYGVGQKNAVDTLTSILKAHAKQIIDAKITPQEIKGYLSERLMLILNRQDNTELEKKKIWGTWLELLAILNIIKNKALTIGDLPDLFKKIRLFYSDVATDFWVTHLNDLPKLDYSGLEKGGIVCVSSNCEAKGNIHVLDLKRIPEDITRLRKEHDIESIGLNIDNSHEFPFDNYKFLNISAFKEGLINEDPNLFHELDINNCILKLQELYGQIISI